MRVLAWFAWPLVAACGGAPEPCLGASSCPAGRECLAARCVPEGSVPVDAGADRLLLNPIGLALAEGETPSGLGPSVTLGNPASAPNALYIRFPRLPARPIETAFLLLDQSAGALAGGDREIEVWRADQAWSGESFAWRRRPRVSAPFARAIARSVPPSPVRADVTALVRSAAEHPEDDYGFAVLPRSTGGAGVTLDTGLGSGRPPRLDVYFKPSAARPPPAVSGSR